MSIRYPQPSGRVYKIVDTLREHYGKYAVLLKTDREVVTQYVGASTLVGVGKSRGDAEAIIRDHEATLVMQDNGVYRPPLVVLMAWYRGEAIEGRVRHDVTGGSSWYPVEKGRMPNFVDPSIEWRIPRVPVIKKERRFIYWDSCANATVRVRASIDEDGPTTKRGGWYTVTITDDKVTSVVPE